MRLSIIIQLPRRTSEDVIPDIVQAIESAEPVQKASLLEVLTVPSTRSGIVLVSECEENPGFTFIFKEYAQHWGS